MAAVKSFLFFCRDELASQLAAIPDLTAAPLRVLGRIEDVLREALVDPPLALFVELSTSLRLANWQRAALFDLGVRWPTARVVLRGTVGGTVMGVNPPLTGDLAETMRELVGGSTRWNHPSHVREHLRLAVRGRCRMRPAGGGPWRAGHTLDLGCHGAFILSYDEWTVGDKVEGELLDLTGKPLRFQGTVAAFRGWDKSSEFPGIGVRFDEIDHAVIAEAICRPENLAWPRRLATPEG